MLLHTTHGEAVSVIAVVAGVDGAIVDEVQVVAERGRGRTRRPHPTAGARGAERDATGITITGNRDEDHARRYARLIGLKR